jgi:uncharacterized protein YndB with AHSA1/START domain
MALIVSDVAIARPPDEVFSYATDPSRFGEWQSGVVSGSIEGDGQPDVGSRCKMTRRIGGSERTSTSEITEFVSPRVWSVRGLDGPIRADVTVRVDPVDGGRASHVTIQLDFHGHGFGRILAPIVIRQSRGEVPRSCQNLKKRLEQSGHR